MGGSAELERSRLSLDMEGGMNAEPAGRENPHYGTKHMWDFTPPGPDIPSRQPQVMDGMGPRPGPPYKDLRSVRNTAPSPECEASA